MKKGFTLIELLAVIVILAIILAIAIPGITSIINSSTKGAATEDAQMVVKALEYQSMKDSAFDPTTINESNITSVLGIDNSNYQSVSVKVTNGKNYVTIVGKNKWNNLTMAGTKQDMNIYDTVTSFTGGANKPALATGMTPIKWNGSAWVTTTESDSSWYNYDTTNKQWANAKTSDGSMWVWIPRYIYKISSGWHTATVGTVNIQFSKGVDDNWNKASLGAIVTNDDSSASNNTWTNEPVFTFGDNELTGIWVAKFEASNDGSNNVKVIPNVASWRSITINDIFNKTRSMETNNVYGWGTSGIGIDTHMMKNTEWGAVAYLAQSTYGINSEIYKNNSSNYYTGRSGGNVGGSQVTVGGNEYIDTGFYTYDGKCASTTTLAPGINANCTSVGATVSDTSLSYKASTTGNIYGIYDMSGGTWEYLASYVNNGNSALETYGASLIGAASQYKDEYTVGSTDTQTGNYGMFINKKGDALYETSSTTDGSYSWYGDYAFTPNASATWFLRSGGYTNNMGAGIFYFNDDSGYASSSYGFRPVLFVGSGL